MIDLRQASNLFGPAEASAIQKPPHLLPYLNPHWFYLCDTGLPDCPGKEAVERE